MHDRTERQLQREVITDGYMDAETFFRYVATVVVCGCTIALSAWFGGRRGHFDLNASVLYSVVVIGVCLILGHYIHRIYVECNLVHCVGVEENGAEDTLTSATRSSSRSDDPGMNVCV
jgi:hypothetical protein